MFDPAHQVPFAIAAAVYVFLFVLLLVSRSGGATRALLAVGCSSTAVWAAAAVAGLDSGTGLAGAGVDLARAAAWCSLMIYLVGQQLRGRRRTVVLAGCLASIAALTFGFAWWTSRFQPESRGVLLGHLAMTVYGVFLADNLYRGTEPDRRWHINLLFIGIGGMFVYDFLFYADALLFGQFSPLLADGRPIAAAIAAPLIAVTAARNRDWVIDIHVSRDAVFHTGSLIVSGVFLLGLAMVGETFRMIGPAWGAAAEAGLVMAGAAVVAISLTSGSTRSRLRHLLVDNFYSHRYDYRKEWLKCIATLSVPADRSGPGNRIVKALAAVTDSPGGQLWLRDIEGSAFHWKGSLNLPPAIGSEPADSAFAAAFRGGDWVMELNAQPELPEWLGDIRGAWLAVPLQHLGRLLGFVVLSAPRAPLRLDREVFDLLRIIGRQAASHAAEWQYVQAMLETAQLRDFGKRFAFAIHDMKNVAGQLGMIVQNAARFRGDAEFQEDVLYTVEAAFDRVTALISRLRREPEAATELNVSDPVELIEAELASIRQSRGVAIGLRHDGRRSAVAMDAGHLRGVIGHLCDNAIEASDGGVTVVVHHQQSQVHIDVADTGAGMAAEFIRDKLFKPFGSTKCDGFGIGAYQARELLRSAGGDLLVHSRPGIGTTMRIVLPCIAQAAEHDSLSSV